MIDPSHGFCFGDCNDTEKLDFAAEVQPTGPSNEGFGPWCCQGGLRAGAGSRDAGKSSVSGCPAGHPPRAQHSGSHSRKGTDVAVPRGLLLCLPYGNRPSSPQLTTRPFRNRTQKLNGGGPSYRQFFHCLISSIVPYSDGQPIDQATISGVMPF
jgi:hypothetical protein